MPKTYTIIQGEMIDAICHRAYGDESGYVEQVLDVNRGLAAQGPVLPMGTEITLPDLAKASDVVPVVSLWD